MFFLGLDIGTSAIKAVLVDGQQEIVARASMALETARPRAVWSEQDPQDWWRGVRALAATIASQAPAAWRSVRAIGLSGQMHGTVLLDEQGTIIRPAILWNDGRALAEAGLLADEIDGIATIAGVKPMAGFAAPKILWLRRHEPAAYKRIAMVLMPKDYIRWRLTGSFATDMCDASGSLWLDVAQRHWSEPIVTASGLSAAQLPRLIEGNAISGALRGDVAQEWGLDPATVVAGGAGDIAAGAVGIGAIGEGDAFLSLGTSAQYFVAREKYAPAPDRLIHSFCHALPDRWFQMAALLNGASCLAWVADLLHAESISALLDEVDQNFAGPSELLFLPYLAGERTPHDDPNAKGVIFGLTPGTGRAQIALAVLEGVALSLADCQDSLEQAGTVVCELGAIGGGVRSRLWMRIIAAALRRPIDIFVGGDTGPAFGAARLARLSVTGEPAQLVCRRPAVAERILPGRVLADAYAGRLERFRMLYRALAPSFAEG